MMENQTRYVMSDMMIGADKAPAAAEIEDVSTADFKTKVMDASATQPVLVDFWAPWCGPCKQLAPVLEKVVKSAEGKVKLVKMNIDDHPQIPGQLGVKSIPAVIAFQRGQPVDGFMGAVPESQIKGFIERLIGPIGSAIKDMLAAAEEALQGGQFEQALSLFQETIEADGTSADAFAGMAKTFVRMGDLEAAKEFIEALEENVQTSAAVAAARTELALAEQAGSIGDLGELKSRLEQNPADHAARFELAVGLNAAGEFSAAADELLAIIKANKSWNEEAARKQLVEFFEVWGPMAEPTREARRKLSAALFS
ncbi:MAG: thioredoxin [Beijerinckiaceae bacterium]|nr:thioredoxin [Beijerinckiaceae bacterium]